jgi:hypothetical protein
VSRSATALSSSGRAFLLSAVELMPHISGQSDVPVLRRASRHARDGRTVALVFGTKDFDALLTNWACHALSLGVRWFVLVAMDRELYASFTGRKSLRRHTVLLPRVRAGNVTLTKLNVIGERQRYGLRALEVSSRARVPHCRGSERARHVLVRRVSSD